MKILLVDDEKHALRGVSRLIESEVDGWQVETAMSGAAALEMLDAETFNVIVSEMQMSGMDGATLLSIVEKRHPKVVRVVLSGQADRQTVLSAVKPMHQYLSKPCDLNQLIRILKRAEIYQDTISSTAVLDAIGKANCLPSLPNIVRDISDAMACENWTSRSIANVIEKDPLLSARILQVANSAIFALAQPVLNVEQGVALIGSDVIQSLALSQVISERRTADSAALTTSMLFNHCFHVAVLAKEFSRRAYPSHNEIGPAFSGALLHDIGKLVLMDAFPDQYPELLSASSAQHRPSWELESERLDATHQSVGAYLLELWGVPTSLVEVVGSHHDFDACAHGTHASQIVYGANWLSRGGDEMHIAQGLEVANHSECARQFAHKLFSWKHETLELPGTELTR